MTAISTLTLPAITIAAPALETANGRLSAPSYALPEKQVAIDAGLAARLCAAAREAAGKTYSPYSAFPVGAALVMADDPEGRIFTGCNVENAAYSPGNCAERTAIFTAAAMGFRKIRMLAVTCLKTRAEELSQRSPCGVCRQVIREFSAVGDWGETLIIVDSGRDGELGQVFDMDRLLPFSFGPDALS